MRDRGERVYEVVRLVRPMTLSSARVVEDGLRRHGLTVGMRAVLEILVGSGPLTVPDVARVLDVSRQAAQRLVNELIVAGHVRLVANPRHRRSPLVAPTAVGTSAFDVVRAQELEQLAGLAAEVSDEDLETTRRVMERLAGDIKSRAQATRPARDDSEEDSGG